MVFTNRDGTPLAPPLNPLAFPDRGAPGMSLRDYFAAKAMQGLLAGPCGRDGVPSREWIDVVAPAYKLADAMLAERVKGATV